MTYLVYKEGTAGKPEMKGKLGYIQQTDIKVELKTDLVTKEKERGTGRQKYEQKQIMLKRWGRKEAHRQIHKQEDRSRGKNA